MHLSRKHEPVLVPHWVYRHIQRAELPLNTVLNLQKLKAYCSQEDLASILLLNRSAGKVFGNSPHIRMELERYWKTFSASDFVRIADVEQLYADSFEHRMFHGDQATAASCAQPPETGFHIQSVESGLDTKGVMLVVIHPGCFQQGPGGDENRAKLVREYLKQSYVFCSYDEVAKDPVYAQYLCNLQNSLLSTV